ncbi:MAG: divalent-cation tolerance protein CutA [Candidatus Omnitrophica bacterium]|nr:divalent-cation tolerance protein CutA [Candidatus Omnitrophota bacterium]MDD5310340.1 divalent-cation tolerance protein CutA [Candidatus Omnitrophota bacterium]MDD5545885.1 divalent-cation tolerance protein CutA [Candidatus Omnitrophota bacterium]
MKKIAILVTAGSKKEAGLIARALVEKKLAACVNIVPSIRSIYAWKGRIEASEEYLLIAKTRENLFSRVEKAVKSLHSYECPEITALPLTKGSTGYMRWIEESTRR